MSDILAIIRELGEQGLLVVEGYQKRDSKKMIVHFALGLQALTGLTSTPLDDNLAAICKKALDNEFILEWLADKLAAALWPMFAAAVPDGVPQTMIAQGITENMLDVLIDLFLDWFRPGMSGYPKVI